MRARFGSGSLISSLLSEVSCFPLRQFPPLGALATEFTTLSA